MERASYHNMKNCVLLSTVGARLVISLSNQSLLSWRFGLNLSHARGRMWRIACERWRQERQTPPLHISQLHWSLPVAQLAVISSDCKHNRNPCTKNSESALASQFRVLKGMTRKCPWKYRNGPRRAYTSQRIISTLATKIAVFWFICNIL